MNLDQEIARWHKGAFPDADELQVFRKLCEEIGELGEALGRLAAARCPVEHEDRGALNDDAQLANVCHEIGDCGVALSRIATMLRFEGLLELMGPVFQARKERA